MRTLAALVVLIVAGCSRSRTPSPPSGLHVIVNGLAAVEPCAHVIPSQWSPSRPVPVLEGGNLAYRLFFFGRDGDPKQGFRFHQPEGDSEFTPDGKVLSCARRAQPGAPIAEAGRQTGESLDSILEKENRLFSMTEDVSALFAAGKPLTADEKKRVGGFSSAFDELIVPGHAPAYRAMSPAFWIWVEANGARVPAL